eukprot:1149452-Pelagomonas_calceolata.AAC.1
MTPPPTEAVPHIAHVNIMSTLINPGPSTLDPVPPATVGPEKVHDVFHSTKSNFFSLPSIQRNASATPTTANCQGISCSLSLPQTIVSAARCAKQGCVWNRLLFPHPAIPQ